MKRLFLLLALAVCSCAGSPETLETIVPKPAELKVNRGRYRLYGTSISCSIRMDSLSVEAVSRFRDRLSMVMGESIEMSCAESRKNAICFIEDTSLAGEEYIIDVRKCCVKVYASGLNGFVYGIQTLMQMLPSQVYGNLAAADADWSLPCCEIRDCPRFAYRGMHLDVARHFYTIDEVKKYLDVMTMYKLNRFHWHLSEDQGWRIEIKSCPDLARIGSQREGTMMGHDFTSNDHVPYGGYYTTEEAKEIVEYAAARGITVVPEIDLPGHMLSALAVYPELGCTGGPYKVWTRWGISEDVLCPGNEATFTFLENVLSDICDIFPSEYIHIGGDECPKARWENCPKCQALIRKLGLADSGEFSKEQYLQNYVTARVQAFLSGKGRKVIGWDEVLEGNLAPGATVMSWRGSEGGQQAAVEGFDAIMTPCSHLYFDYCQSENAESEPLSIGGYIPLEKVYSFDPMEGIAPENQNHIIGVQANLWTEYIASFDHVEYMLLPRMLALSEVQWCRPENRDWNRFLESVKNHQIEVLETAGYNYRRITEN